MNQSNTSLAMDLSSGFFAYHLIGVMTACSEAGSVCPDPEAEALNYLQIFYPEALEAEEANYNNENFRQDA